MVSMVRVQWVNLTVASVLISGKLLAQVRGQDTFFLPGDAFFHTRLTEEIVNQIRDNQRTRLGYARLSGCASRGSAGYGYLEFNAVPDYLKEGLYDAYWWVRSCSPARFRDLRDIQLDEATGVLKVSARPQVVEELGVSTFFYNSEFDFRQHWLGLRFNESCFREVERFGFRRGNIDLDEFFSTPEALAHNWQMAELVGPLNVTLPEGDVPDRKFSEEPVYLSGQVIALLPMCDDTQKYLDFDLPFDLIVVSEKGVWHHVRFDKDWNNWEPQLLSKVRIESRNERSESGGAPIR
jgi:hypothetical protein